MRPYGALRADCVLQRRFCLIAHGKPLVCVCVCVHAVFDLREKRRKKSCEYVMIWPSQFVHVSLYEYLDVNVGVN